MIDFGISKTYRRGDGSHIKRKKERVPFSGNVLFASKNAFGGVVQTRRDDLLSLAYLMVFLTTGSMKWLT